MTDVVDTIDRDDLDDEDRLLYDRIVELRSQLSAILVAVDAAGVSLDLPDIDH